MAKDQGKRRNESINSRNDDHGSRRGSRVVQRSESLVDSLIESLPPGISEDKD